MTDKQILATKFGEKSVSEGTTPMSEMRTIIKENRKFKFGTLATILASTLLLSTLGTVSSSAAPSTLGAVCAKKGALTNAATSGKLVCAKSGTKLVWQYQPVKIINAVASATIQVSDHIAILAVANGMGYFKAENLTVENILTSGATAAVQAVASGQANIAAGDLGGTLSAVEKGVSLKVVGGLVSVWPWRIAVLPSSSITSPANLKGKKIGVISLASGSFPYAKAVVESADFAITDAEYVPVGIGAPAAAALASGQVDALALYTAAFAQIESAGTTLRYLKNPTTFDGVRSATWVVNSDYAAKNPQVLERFLRANYKALTFSGTSPEKAMYIGYQEFPTLLAGSTKADRITPDIRALKAWLESAGISNPGTTNGWPKVWGDIPVQDWLRTQSYSTAAGQIKRAITIGDVWLPKFLIAANNFDRKAVIAQAKKYKPLTS
jgi:NitT/TauT family transport system substrate-binding protein